MRVGREIQNTQVPNKVNADIKSYTFLRRSWLALGSSPDSVDATCAARFRFLPRSRRLRLLLSGTRRAS